MAHPTPAFLERNALAEALSREVARCSSILGHGGLWSGEVRAIVDEALEEAHRAFAVPCPTQAAFVQKRALERLQGF